MKKEKLEQIWQQLDDASGSLYNALEALKPFVKRSTILTIHTEMLDISIIDNLKNEIEKMMEDDK